MGKVTHNIIESMSSPNMFGALFEDAESWRPWFAFLRAFYGLPMDARDLELFRKHTGRQTPAPGGYPEAVVITGRQSGKTKIASTVAAYEVAQAVLSGQRGVYVPLVAQDLRGAQRALYGYLRQAIETSPALSREVVKQTATEIELAGITAGVYPCRPAAVRGIRAACAVVDELGFFVATDGRPTDSEMLHSVRPALATTGGRLLILSSPYGMSGALYELHRKHYGQDSTTLVWQSSAPEMNPGLPADYLERMKSDDPEAYRSEVLGEFRSGVSTFLDPDALAEVVEIGVRERPPQDGIKYRAYIDAASGSGKDSFAVGIAHKDGERSTLDVIRRWPPPFNPSGVIAEACDLLKRYRIREAQGDRYAPGFVAEGFRAHGITYKASPRTTSEVYLELLPLVNSKAVCILDEPRLLRELRGLERRRGTAGRDKVDHRRGEHDDAAVAASGALVSAQVNERRPVACFGTYGQHPDDDGIQRGYRQNQGEPSRLFGRAGSDDDPAPEFYVNQSPKR